LTYFRVARVCQRQLGFLVYVTGAITVIVTISFFFEILRRRSSSVKNLYVSSVIIYAFVCLLYFCYVFG